MKAKFCILKRMMGWLVVFSLLLAGCTQQVDRNATRKKAVDLIARLGVPEADILSEVDGGTPASGETWVTFYFVIHDDVDSFENKLITEAKVTKKIPRWGEARFGSIKSRRLMIRDIQSDDPKIDDVITRGINWNRSTIDGKGIYFVYFDLSKETVLLDRVAMTGTLASLRYFN